MNILLDDIPYRESLYPFGQVRSVAHIRVGILSVFEKWQLFFPGKVLIQSELKSNIDYSSCLTFPANLVPSGDFLRETKDRLSMPSAGTECKILEYPWQITEYNGWAITEDFKLLTSGRKSKDISPTMQLINPGNIFVEEGAKVNFATLNADTGPIYIGKDAEIEEGSLLRGPVSIGEGSRVKMGTRIYCATTIGPYCIAGGEIKNSVLTAFSNKGHDGYLGDSVIGRWCNIGAGTSNSNLKNSAGIIKMWSKKDKTYVEAGYKCGLLMGDYSRSAINTSFNTGTIVGVCCNIFENTFERRYIDDFTWGDEKYIFEKAISDINNWKKLKGHEITHEEIESLKNIYQTNEEK
jgi:UDP-N-acetylglucosamine diphosphorylase/glucosamine-1-phosphate N-acetyltransferase